MTVFVQILRKTGHTYMQWTFALIANLTTMSYGLENGWISPIAKLLQSEQSPTGVPMSDNTLSWVASSMSMAAVLGVPIFSFIADKYGRKICIILICAPQAISWIIRISYSTNVTVLIARIIAGLSAGGIFNVVPLYAKEISQDDVRGVLGSFLALGQTIGLFVMYVLGSYLNYYTVMYIALLLSIITAILMIKAPESPAYLVRRGKIDEATITLAYLRGMERDDEKVSNEINHMKEQDAVHKSLPTLSYVTIFNDRAWRCGICLVFMIFTVHSLNGAFAIVTYAQTILESTGVEFGISAELQILSIPLVMIIASILLIFCVERCGRKVLLAGSLFVTSASMFTLAAAILVTHSGGAVPSWLPVIAMVLSVAMFAAGVCPIPYIITTEMFSYQIRGKVMGAVVVYTWCFTSTSVLIYTAMTNAFGQYTTFFFFGTVNLLGGIFCSIFLPETKGKSDEEIRNILDTGKPAKQNLTQT